MSENEVKKEQDTGVDTPEGEQKAEAKPQAKKPKTAKETTAKEETPTVVKEEAPVTAKEETPIVAKEEAFSSLDTFRYLLTNTTRLLKK